MKKVNFEEIEETYLDIETIKERKKLYGNNLPEIASLWNQDLTLFQRIFCTKCSPARIALLLAYVKVSRINKTRIKLNEILRQCDPKIDMTDEKNYSKEYLDTKNAFTDSCKDYANYMWISKNYQAYLLL